VAGTQMDHRSVENNHVYHAVCTGLSGNIQYKQVAKYNDSKTV